MDGMFWTEWVPAEGEEAGSSKRQPYVSKFVLSGSGTQPGAISRYSILDPAFECIAPNVIFHLFPIRYRLCVVSKCYTSRSHLLIYKLVGDFTSELRHLELRNSAGASSVVLLPALDDTVYKSLTQVVVPDRRDIGSPWRARIRRYEPS